MFVTYKIMKKILGLDLGTNSIGWALVATDEEGKPCKIEGLGTRIIPMTQDVLESFGSGKPIETQTASRTTYRGTRRLRERHLLRRERLHRVLHLMGFLPGHYEKGIDLEKRLGKFKTDTEPKLAWKKDEDGGFEFIFQNSYHEMLNDFSKLQPQLLSNNKRIPYDWTIYFLRKKALTQKIQKEELAWILLNFNQKRGYYQLRGEDENESLDKLVEYYALRVVDVKADEAQKGKSDIWYNIILENGWVYRRSSKNPLYDWIGKEKEFIVTTDLNEDGAIKTDKEGIEKRSFRAPSENDWNLLKKKSEADINKSNKTVGEYIYDTLLSKPNQKIRGKLVRTIERKFYKKELKQILEKQIELQPELFSDEVYNDCIRELYRNNEVHQLILSHRNFVHLFLEDIIFYQRPLRSQKSGIGNCSLEYRTYKDKDGNKMTEYLKVIPKSNPLYQEFRVWQWLSNLKIYRKEDDADITSQFIKNIDDRTQLFEFLMTQKEVNHKDILKHILLPLLREKYPNAKITALNKEVDKEISKYRWNYVFDDSKDKEEDKSKKYSCNTTGCEIRRRLDKVERISCDFLTPEIELKLWHIIYSVTDKNEYKAALGTFAEKHNLDIASFVDNFEKFPPFKSEYGSYSEKAIKRFLPLMRVGKYWNWDVIDLKTQDRIYKIITGEYDDVIKDRVREKAIDLTEEFHFQSLPVWLASYIIYDRHSEADIIGKWDSVKDLETYLKDFKQHSLRNPIVEQVVTETLRIVRDIWEQFGHGAKGFFDEIHIELGREMKNTAEDRKRISEQINNNENTNLRIKALLMELYEDSDGELFVENVRPYSPMQQDALRIFEEYALQNEEKYIGKDESGQDKFVYDPVDEDILKISKTPEPTKPELQRYKLWLEQRYRSPYTGQMIPLGKLFTNEYQIEHIIPRSRYFDDSFNNKVICESVVNQLKDNQLGFEFIKNHYGEEVELGFGKKVRILTEDQYKDFIKEHYAKNNSKRRNLLLDEIPEKMIARQLNDTRYISKFISGLLSNIVRAEKDDDGINSKNIITVNGKITSILKQDWGLNDVWNDLILPRFERMNTLTNSTVFTVFNGNYQKYLPTVPLELSKNFQKKRIDHRHHAKDALIIACATRDHVNLLNNQSARSAIVRYDLQNKLRNKEKFSWIDKKTGRRMERDVFKEFKKPWTTFTADARNMLINVIASFKQNLRIINKATNKYVKYVDEEGKKKKEKVDQKGVNWAVRKPLHKEFVYAKVDLPFVKKPKDKIITAIRRSLDTSFDLKKIESITDTGIQKILKNYLFEKGNNPALAFSPEGIEDMNKNIVSYNDGKFHQPILKVRTFEIGNRFALGESGNKKEKYVEAAKGTNLFFAVYADNEGNRSYESIPLNIVIERLKQGLHVVPERKNIIEKKQEKELSLLFYISPNDLVYVPTEDESDGRINIEDFGSERIYKMVSCTGKECHFVPVNIATPILKTTELGSNNKSERSWDGVMIKQCCIKLKIDRLGNIKS